jgi:hypothetical protein
MNDSDTAVLVVCCLLLCAVLYYIYQTKGILVTSVRYLKSFFFDDVYKLNEKQQYLNHDNIMIVFPGMNYSCKQTLDIPKPLLYHYVRHVYCFEYPSPGLDNWLQTFYNTTYQTAKNNLPKRGGNMILKGYSLGGWFALMAAKYISEKDPDITDRIRVVSIAPMTHWVNIGRERIRTKVITPPKYHNKDHWHVFASTEDKMFLFNDIKATYSKIANIHQVTGDHNHITIDELKLVQLLGLAPPPFIM